MKIEQLENSLPARLKSWRAKHDLTQRAAASKLGVKIRTWESWECGQRAPVGIGLAALLKRIGGGK